MFWFEARSVPASIHDFQVTLAVYVVCLMFISDLSHHHNSMCRHLVEEVARWSSRCQAHHIRLSERLNWSHVIKPANRKLGICCCVALYEVESAQPLARTLQSLKVLLLWQLHLVRMSHTPALLLGMQCLAI